MRRIIFFTVLISMLACNPVKQAFKPKYIEKTKVEFYSRGLCVNDTMTDTLIVHDSVIIKDIVKVVKFKEARLEKFNLDTIVDGVKILIVNGSISVSCPEKIRVEYRTKSITNSIRDLGYENVLKNTISIKDSVILDTQNEMVKFQQKYYKYKFYIWMIGLIIALLVIIRIYKIFSI